MEHMYFSLPSYLVLVSCQKQLTMGGLFFFFLEIRLLTLYPIRALTN